MEIERLKIENENKTGRGEAELTFYSSPFDFCVVQYIFATPREEGIGSNLLKLITTKITKKDILGIAYRVTEPNEVGYNILINNGWEKVLSGKEWFCINRKNLSSERIYSTILNLIK